MKPLPDAVLHHVADRDGCDRRLRLWRCVLDVEHYLSAFWAPRHARPEPHVRGDFHLRFADIHLYATLDVNTFSRLLHGSGISSLSSPSSS
jgi:hypothetical protein